MKKFILILAATAGLSGCVSFPQTAGDMRAMTSSSLVKKTSFSVARSPNAVAASMRQLSSKCLNRITETQQIYRQGQYGPQSISFKTKWETSVRSIAGRTELAMRMVPIRGAVNEPKEGYIFYVVDAAPAGSQTNVSIYGGSIGVGSFNSDIKAWVAGRKSSCPEMPR